MKDFEMHHILVMFWNEVAKWSAQLLSVQHEEEETELSTPRLLGGMGMRMRK